MSDTKMRSPLAGHRRLARQFALLGVYESLIDTEADFAAIDANLLSVITEEGEPVSGCELTEADFVHCDKEFYRRILAGVLDERDELTQAVAKHLDRDPARLSVIERACLMIGAWELKHCIETPYRVVINEAVELSKRFGADKGYKLVNGVLDKVAGDIRPDEHNA